MDRFALLVRKACLSALSGLLLLSAGEVRAVTDAERIQVYRDFRAAFDAGKLAEALPLAERLAALTEEQFGADNRALVVPLTNIGTVQFRLANHAAAETAFQRALAIAEAQATSGADESQIRPLHGLGEVLLATGRHDAAAIALDRAVDLTRNLKGLYDVSQLAILPSLIESYKALQNYQLAEKEHQYAFRVAETSYGRADRRLLGPLDYYARWYEFVGRYTTARVLHARGLQIAEQSAGQNSLLAVRPLRGLARTYWLEYIYGPEEAEEQQGTQQQQESITSNVASGGRLNPDGEKALQLAISTLNKQQPENHADLGDTLVDLGDWYLLAGNSGRAADAFRLAYQQYERVNLIARIAQPQLLTYRATSMSTLRFRPENPDDYDTVAVDARLQIGADGKVRDAVAVNSTAPEATTKAVLAALKRARYRPRIDATGTVDTADYAYSEKIFVRKAPAAAPPK